MDGSWDAYMREAENKSPKNISKGLEKYYFRAKEPRHGQGAI